jgi:hypothetical protein
LFAVIGVEVLWEVGKVLKRRLDVVGIKVKEVVVTETYEI